LGGGGGDERGGGMLALGAARKKIKGEGPRPDRSGGPASAGGGGGRAPPPSIEMVLVKDKALVETVRAHDVAYGSPVVIRAMKREDMVLVKLGGSSGYLVMEGAVLAEKLKEYAEAVKEGRVAVEGGRGWQGKEGGREGGKAAAAASLFPPAGTDQAVASPSSLSSSATTISSSPSTTSSSPPSPASPSLRPPALLKVFSSSSDGFALVRARPSLPSSLPSSLPPSSPWYQAREVVEAGVVILFACYCFNWLSLVVGAYALYSVYRVREGGREGERERGREVRFLHLNRNACYAALPFF